MASVGRHMATTALANLSLPIAAFAAGPILALALGVEGRGELSAAIAPLMLTVALGTIGIPEAVNYFVARHHASHKPLLLRATWILGFSGLLATLVCFALSHILSGNNLELRNLILIASAATIPTLAIGALRGAAQGLHLWARVNLDKYITGTTRLTGLVILWFTGSLTPFTAMLVMILSPIFGALSYVGLKNSAISIRDQQIIRTRSILGYGSRIWIGSLSGILLARLDQVLMTPLAGTYELGLYVVAVNIADVVLIANHAVRDVIFSFDAKNNNNATVYKSARISFLTSIVIGAGIAITLVYWLPILFGEEFRASAPAVYILLAAAVLGVPGSIAGAVLASRGRPELRSYGLAAATIVNMGLIFLLVPSFGAVGAGFAMLAGNITAANFNIVCVKRLYGMPISQFYMVRMSDVRLLIFKSASVAQRLLRKTAPKRIGTNRRSRS